MHWRRILKGCLLVLFVGLLTFSGPMPGAEMPIGLAQGPEETMVFLGDALDKPSDSVEGTELPERRTLTSKTFQIGPDEYRAVLSSGPLHYLDEAGNWQNIETEVERRDDGGYQAEANIVKARFPRQIGAGRIEIELRSDPPGGPNSTRYEAGPAGAAGSSDDVSLSWQPTALAYSTGGDLAAQRISSENVVQVPATVSGNIVAYQSALPGVTEEFTVVPGGVKHSLILSSLPGLVPQDIPPDSFLDYEVEMALSPDIGLYVDGVEQVADFSTSSVIELRRGQKEIVGYLLAPYAYERDNPRAMTAGTHLVRFEPGRIALTVRIPLSWLAAPDRVYPVVIDPTTNAHLSQDTFIAGGYPSSSFGHWIEMYAGYDSAFGFGLEKSLMRWNVDPIPANSIINTAEIQLYQFSSQGNTSCGLGFYRLLTPWSSAYATWNQSYFGVPWSLPGASGIGSDYDGMGYGISYSATNGWKTTGHQIGFGSWVSDWLADPASNYGIMLKPPGNPTTHDCERGFRTMNHGSAPYLEVDYTFTGGAPTLLLNNEAQTHTYPNPEHYFVEDSASHTVFWRGTAMRPLDQSDFDQWLHTQADFSEWRVGSSYGVGRVDYTLTKEFVSTTGYPRVTRVDGTDNYNIQYMHRLTQINPPYSGGWIMGSEALWAVYEIYLGSPGTWRVIVTPTGGDPDLGIAIHDPTTGDYHTRGSALAISDQVGQNLTEEIEFTASSAGFYGLVVWSNVRTGVSQYFQLEVKAPYEKTYLPLILKNYVPPQGPFSNGGFENNSRWVLAGELEHQRTTAKKRSGSYSLRLGHDGEGPCLNGVPCSGSGEDCQSVATATQGFDVPGSANNLKLYYQIYTYDHKPEGDRAADHFAVYIRDLSTSEKTLVYKDDLSWVSSYQCYNLSKKSSWQTVSGIDLSPYRGKTVELILEVANGGHNFWNTWVFIDDVICNGC